MQGRRQKIQRCIVLEYNLQCVLTITKDYIFYVYVNKSQLGLAFDAIRKVTEYFNSNSIKIFQGAKNGPAKLEILNKRFVQFMSFFEQFLCTRQFPLQRQRQIFNLNPLIQSNKRKIDFQIFNKFSHISQQNDKRIILQMSKSSNKVSGLQICKKMRIIEHMKKFSMKNQDQLDLLEIDPQKQNYLNNYKKNLIRFAHCGKIKTYSLINEKYTVQKQVLSQNNFIIQQQILQETIIEKQRIKLKLMVDYQLKSQEKLQLHLFQGKIKEVIQFGQVIAQGNQAQTATINLLKPEQHWTNSKIISKRTSPNSFQIKQITPSKYQFSTVNDYKSKPIIDYIIRKQTFTPEKIPLLFVYTIQSNASNIEFVFKYKLNEKWKDPLNDIEIVVCLNPQFIVSGDCKTIPMAVSLKNHKIIWKTKEISQNSSSKGKILLAFTSSNIPARSIIKQIKLSMKCLNKGILEGLNAQCFQEDNQRNRAQKILLINYKVQPNQ